jgi:hypothetical protein
VPDTIASKRAPAGFRESSAAARESNADFGKAIIGECHLLVMNAHVSLR